MVLTRFLVYLAAIAAWIMLWVGAMALGPELGQSSPGGRLELPQVLPQRRARVLGAHGASLLE